ncbi:glutactin isoform X1 [Drosophila guanche]|uniref:Blast:Glutactin n=1 Tax=Drosophila guanche TaxID=7266 RepID=A0A3B0JGK6_DROGU|nr:glutactin isoform X1 [Drosophila guanche]SPP81487.1 blast:Glutactin [Drosophila guanche]
MQSLPSWVQLLALALCVCQMCALQPRPRSDDDDYDFSAENEDSFTPQPLRPPPWQEAPQPQEARVQVPGVGDIVGVRGYKAISGRPINAFLGVRYAQVGAGLGRFQQARATSFQGRVDATTASPNCAQFPELQRLQAAEARGENVDDCLTLNIYAPEGARDLPVLVFVHGEMLFDGGAEEAQPDYVLENDIVLVSINYRLAPFGFLSALSDQLPGNVALSDIHLALEWLQRNLPHFGGNSGKVTLVGQAGGATLVHALSLSGRATNLFQQLILQSGTALNPYLIDERPLETLATFARLARCQYAGRSLAPLYDCLSRLPTSQVVSAFEQLLQQNEARGLSFLGGFKLVVGDPLGYLPEHPAALAAKAANSSVPMIVGAAKDASAFILSRFYDQIQRVQSQNVSDFINVVLRHTAPPSQHKAWLDWARREIFSQEHDRTASAHSVSQGLLELSNMILYRAPVIYSIRLSHKKSPVYLYTFDYRGEHHRFGHLDNPLPFGVDASLSDDSVYLFPYPPEASRLNPVDKSLSRALVTMWVNFAVTGIPNQNSGVWPKATSEYGPFLRFTNSRQSMLELDPHFGDGLYAPNLYGQYFNATNSTTTATAATTTTTTTTTTTRRPYVYNPYVNRQPNPYPYNYNATTTTSTTTTTTRRPMYAYNPYANWQPNRQPGQAQPFPRRPTDPAYERAQEIRRQQVIREQQEREQRIREQREREQQQQEEQQRREEEEREQRRVQEQREQEAQRELEQRYQMQREKQQREQQQREQLAREQQEVLEQQQREQEAREQWERNRERTEVHRSPQEELEQRQREWERQQREREREQTINPDEPDDRELEEREQQEREEQQRLQILHEQRLQYEQRQREQQQREQEQREQLAREQQEQQEQQQREQEQREQEEREQQEREEQQREEMARGYQPYEPEQQESSRRPYPSYEDYVRRDEEEEPLDFEPEIDESSNRNYSEEQEREQQQREQLYREQQEREREQQEQEREQQERERQSQNPNEDEEDQQDRRQPYQTYEEYLRANEEAEAAAAAAQESEPEPEPEPEPERENDPSAYESYDDYIRAQQERQEAEERERAVQEGWEHSRPEYPGYRQFVSNHHSSPQHAKQLRRQQRPNL